MNQEQEVFYVETIEAMPGKTNELKEALLTTLPHAKKEQGILSFDLCQDCTRPHIFIVWIRFKNRQAYDDHLNAPYIQEFIKKYDASLYKNVEEEFYQKLH